MILQGATVDVNYRVVGGGMTEDALRAAQEAGVLVVACDPELLKRKHGIHAWAVRFTVTSTVLIACAVCLTPQEDSQDCSHPPVVPTYPPLLP